ncbi:MAG TPA: cyanophycin synthetase [Longimicrobium sp.]|nr:cyanophycin synthetase [Longimicrobium sp.]
MRGGLTDTPAESAPALRIRSARALRGPSIWAVHPVAACEVQVSAALADTPPTDLPGLAQRLSAALPGLAAERTDGGGDSDPSAAWAGLAGRVAVALQTLAGTPVTFVRVQPGTHGDLPQLAVGYAEAELGVESLYEAEALLLRLMRGEDAEMDSLERKLRQVHHDARPRATARVLIEAARRRGIPVRRFADDPVFQLGLGRTLRRLDAAMSDSTSVIAADITSDNDRTRRILARSGLPVPEGGIAADAEAAVVLARRIRFPVLLKPLGANDGRGISGKLETEEAVRAAYPIARAEHPTVIVERFAEGRDHRVVVVNGRVVAVAERIPARVVGDGMRTIGQLAEAINADPRRDPLVPDPTLVRIPLDSQTAAFLARTGRTLASVPAMGETVQLRTTANLSTGGTSTDRTDEIHPRNALLCELAVAAVGLDIAGLDVLTDDIGVPFDENGATLLEVNTSPGIRMHTDPDQGAPRDVPGAILDMLYPPGAATTIPVIAVTGTNGKTTTTRLVAHLFRRTGACVGYTTTDGIYFQEHLLQEGDFTGPFAAGVVLANPWVDVAVLEAARGGILRSGLGFDACDVGIVLNVTADHLGLRGIHTTEDLARVKSVIPSVVKPGGHAVLNADDPLVLGMRSATPGTVVLTSVLGEANPAVAEHRAAGGMAIVVEEDEGGRETIVIRGAERVPVAAVDDVPLAMGGAARFQLGNLLAATAAAYLQGIPADAIAEGLRTFIPSGAATPGRMNVLRSPRGTVIVDYAHNPAAVRGLMDFVTRMPAARRIGVVTMPGDRRDEDLREMGEIVSVLDYVVVKEHDHYRRGRPAGDVARLIAEGLEAGGLGPGSHEAVLPEPDAVARALTLMEPGDVVVILADDSLDVLAQAQAFLDAGGA